MVDDGLSMVIWVIHGYMDYQLLMMIWHIISTGHSHIQDYGKILVRQSMLHPYNALYMWNYDVHIVHEGKCLLFMTILYACHYIHLCATLLNTIILVH
jgi:hypothetical protein